MASNACTFRNLTLLLTICFPLVTSIDFNYPAVFNFGDSNSDTGDLLAAGIGDILDPPYGQTYFRKPSGRFCDGRLIIDFLSKHILLIQIKNLDQTRTHTHYSTLFVVNLMKCNSGYDGLAFSERVLGFNRRTHI